MGKAVLTILLTATVALVGTSEAHTTRHRGDRGALPWMGRQPNPSLFGIDTGNFDSVPAHGTRDFGAARALGARWDRLTIGPATGHGDFRTLDREVTNARRHGMGVVLSFEGIAPACSESTVPAKVQRCPPTTRADLARYEAYVRRVVLRYRNVVSYYESWVEANHDTSLMTASQYAALLSDEYAVLQSVNRRHHLQLKLLFGSMVGFSIQPGNANWIAVLPFTHRVLADLHGRRPFDGIALHAYRFPPAREGPSARDCDFVEGVSVTMGTSTPDCPAPSWRELSWPQELEAYEQQFTNHGYGRPPLWLTEFGWPGNLRANGGYFPSYQAQADDLRAAYADLLQMPFMQAAMWFDIRDYQPGLPTPDPSFFYRYGLLNYDYTAKPAGAAFQALAAANPSR